MRTIKEIMRASAVLNADGVHIGGSDRESNHSYGDAYESLFPNRDRIELVMEVGVADGACMLAWRDVFPNALIVGMDIHQSASSYGERLEFHLGDQRNRHDCERAAKWGERLFDVIIEDATHELDGNLLTLFFLWPFVKPGGLYVIEEFADVHSHIKNILALWPNAQIIDTKGPYGGNEPLIVFRKPLS